MLQGFPALVRAEIFVLSKRTATRALLGFWVGVTTLFAYIFPYVSHRTGNPFLAEELDTMLPAAFAQTVAEGIPFYGGSIALILGVLSIGSDFEWNTWKTLLTQRSRRTAVFGAKVAALIAVLSVFAGSMFVAGAIASASIAYIEGTAAAWPNATSVAGFALGGWLIMCVWAAGGVLLATVTRGASLAIGIGILWALAFEGLLSAFASSMSWLEWMVDFLIRANGYSLVRATAGGAELSADGPGAFPGPFVSGPQALLMLTIYLAVFTMGSAWLIQRRDVE